MEPTSPFSAFLRRSGSLVCTVEDQVEAYAKDLLERVEAIRATQAVLDSLEESV